MRQVSLTNTDTCNPEDDDERYASLKLHITPPPCGSIVSANDNSNTIELAMNSDAGCCAIESEEKSKKETKEGYFI